MSDLRSLLDEVTARPVPHTDPVGAVHARVRRRAVRRRAAVAAGTTCAVVAAGVVYAARPAGRALPPTSPTPTPAPYAPAPVERAGPQWRLRSHGGTPEMPDDVYTAVTGLWEYARERPTTFAYLDVWHIEGEWTVLVGVGGDQDAARWRAKVEQLAGDAVAVRFERCAYPASEYDRVRDELEATRWPSGNRLVDLELIDDEAFGRCLILVETMGDGDHAADLRYAEQRWGDAVGMLGPSGVFEIGTPSADGEVLRLDDGSP